MAQDRPIERIEPLEKSSKSTEYGIDATTDASASAPNKERFDSLLSQDHTSQKAAVIDRTPTESIRTSLFDEVRLFGSKIGSLQKVSRKDLVAQAEGVVKQIEELKKKLQTPDLQISKSSYSLLEIRSRISTKICA